MLFPSREVSLTKSRADFRETEFRQLIAQKGYFCTWSQAAACPCTSETTELDLEITEVSADSVSMQQNQACPFCGGGGKLYHSPQEIQVISTSADTDFLNARFGGYKNGVIQLTMNPEHLPGYGDRFVFKDSVMQYSELLKYTGGNTLALKFPAVERTIELATGEATHSVLYMTYSNPVTGVTTGEELVEGQDFTVTNAGNILFTNPPPLNSRVSITYLCSPSYTCISFPHTFRDTRVRFKSTEDITTRMPVQINAKLEFLEGA